MYLSIAHGFPKDFNSPWQGSMPRLNLHSIGEIGSFPGWFGLGLGFFKKNHVGGMMRGAEKMMRGVEK